MSKFIAVIMAGGRGQRFWPLSTSDKPKQFLDLEQSGRSLLQATYDRVLPLAGSAEQIMVATGEKYVELVKEQLPELPVENLIIEPVGRDSGPAVALASLVVQERFGDSVMGFFASDHRIIDTAAFHDTLRRGAELAKETSGLITIGITPTRASTGYGYIKTGEAVSQGGYKVDQFVEKPNETKAKAYLDSGDYCWNAGMFVWQSGAILGELDTFVPEMMRPLRQAVQENTVASVFPSLQKLPIDYAVMEQTSKAYVVPAHFDWDDIGDWVALERLLRKQDDRSTNTILGTHVGLETDGNIIYTENSDDVVVTLGVKDLVIVKQGNTVLLMHKDRVQDIKQLLEDDRLAELTVV